MYRPIYSKYYYLDFNSWFKLRTSSFTLLYTHAREFSTNHQNSGISSAKGQMISKGHLVSSNFPKKQIHFSTTTTNSFVHFLGDCKDTKKSFRNHLTFSSWNPGVLMIDWNIRYTCVQKHETRSSELKLEERIEIIWPLFSVVICWKVCKIFKFSSYSLTFKCKTRTSRL